MSKLWNKKLWIKRITLTFSSLGLATSVAFANPEANNLGSETVAKEILIVRTDKAGNKGFYKSTKKIAPSALPEAITRLEKNLKDGASDANFVKISKVKERVKNSKNREAEGDVAQQTWWHWRHNHYHNRIYGPVHFPPTTYYYGNWSNVYYYNNWAPTYQWCYPVFGYTYAVYC